MGTCYLYKLVILIYYPFVMETAMNIFESGGPIMWPLRVCSLASITITLERIMFWLRENHSADVELKNTVFKDARLFSVDFGGAKIKDVDLTDAELEDVAGLHEIE